MVYVYLGCSYMFIACQMLISLYLVFASLIQLTPSFQGKEANMTSSEAIRP